MDMVTDGVKRVKFMEQFYVLEFGLLGFPRFKDFRSLVFFVHKERDPCSI
jgi:hypothetical protein